MSTKTNLRGITAAGTSALLGVAGSLAGIAPASAATQGPVGVDPCTNISGVFENLTDISSVLDFSAAFVMPCVPQYGFGKVEFTVSSDHDLPDGFDLESSLASQVTNDFNFQDVVSYFGQDPTQLTPDSPSGSFLTMSRIDDRSNTQSATYQGILILPLESIDVVALGDLPVECTGNYTHAYTVTAAPRTTTFSGQAGLTAWSVPVSVTPVPITFAFSVDPSGLSTSGDACLATPTWAQPISGFLDVEETKFGVALLLALGVFSAAGISTDLPFDLTIDSPVGMTVTLEETPALPNTGIDVTAAATSGGLGLLMASLGGALVIVRRRRSSTRGV